MFVHSSSGETSLCSIPSPDKRGYRHVGIKRRPDDDMRTSRDLENSRPVLMELGLFVYLGQHAFRA
jgi:hypothetical protein